MTGLETRSDARDSQFLQAIIRVEQAEDSHKVRVRNLSDGGMMGEGNLRVQRGNRLEIELRNIGRIGGSIAWVQDNRFGIAFDEEVDSQLARRPRQENDDAPARVVERPWRHRAALATDPSSLRKV